MLQWGRTGRGIGSGGCGGKVTRGGEVGGVVGRETDNWIKKWSEMCSGVTEVKSVILLRVRMRSSCFPAVWVNITHL